MALKVQLIATICLILLSGCATMNRSECQTADWRMIGLEDGSQGRALADEPRLRTTMGNVLFLWSEKIDATATSTPRVLGMLPTSPRPGS